MKAGMRIPAFILGGIYKYIFLYNKEFLRKSVDFFKKKTEFSVFLLTIFNAREQLNYRLVSLMSSRCKIPIIQRIIFSLLVTIESIINGNYLNLAQEILPFNAA
ncbi:MAG: hypothetical protein A2W19_03020 [Spirochaetes bacterium RBG_16_49_21]|nr:MAG: hypothetical protein A2W19_03020 [Spirochaetes bacterium RBG_16_49_21]